MRKLIALTLAGVIAMAPISAFAEEDLEARIAALEERVAALEAQIGAPPEGVSAVPEQETVDAGTVETGIVVNGCSLSYKKAEVVNASGKNAVVLYFDFFNGSGETTSAGNEFIIKVFQNGRAQEIASISDNQASKDRYTEFRSGTDPVEVAFARELQDMSDIIVNISSLTDWNAEDVEFTVSLE